MGQKHGIGHAILMGLAQHLGPVLLRILGITLRVKCLGTDNIRQGRAVTGNVIFVCWHGRLLLSTYVHRHESISVLVSTHRDGEYIARVIGGLGFGTVRGSSTRGAMRGVLGLIETAARGLDLGITPDGPGGPRERLQAGIIYLAKKTGIPVIPIGASHKPSLILSSWDRFMIPLPFARCVIKYGEPVTYDASLREESIEQARLDLEERLSMVTREADNGCGRTWD
jgi:lysophospholipid acyltransferase (LPLAT)-like uncharacterized protein